jgi:hypothetical protein
MKSRVFAWEGDEASARVADGMYAQLRIEEREVGGMG